MTSPCVGFAVLNLRLGGQVSSILSLSAALRARGVDARLLAPEGLAGFTREALDDWGARPFATRMAATGKLLRSLRTLLPGGAVLHLVLPSPAMAWTAALADFPPERMVLQYEGPALGLSAGERQALRDDPALLLPRLLLSNELLALAGRGFACTHLATYPRLGLQLAQLGFQRVHCVPNLGAPAATGGATLQLGQGVWVGYLGHCHPVKGVFDLIDAFGRAARQRDDLRLLLCLTRDGHEDRVVARAAALGLGERVRCERVVEVRALLGRLDALALPYRSALTTTMYPSLLLEADEAGCPLIVSRLPELDELLPPPAPGLQLVEPRSIESLAAALAAVAPRSGSIRPPRLRLPPEAARVDSLLTLYRSLHSMP